MNYKIIVSLITIFSSFLWAQDALDTTLHEQSFSFIGKYHFKNDTEKTVYFVAVSNIDKELADKAGVAEKFTAKKKLLPNEDLTLESPMQCEGLSFWPEMVTVVVRYLKNIGAEEANEGKRFFLDVSSPWYGELNPGSYSVKLVDGKIVVEAQ